MHFHERKYYDTALENSGIASTSNCTGGEADPLNILCISAPAQGDGPTNRDGKFIEINYAEITGTLQLAPQTAQPTIDDPTLVYVALVLDKQSNRAQLNSEDVFSNPVNTQLGCATPLRNRSFFDRFDIIDEQYHMLCPSTLVQDGAGPTWTQGGDMAKFELVCKRKINVNFSATVTAEGITAVQDNSLHVIAFASTGDIGITYNARIRFYSF